MKPDLRGPRNQARARRLLRPRRRRHRPRGERRRPVLALLRGRGGGGGAARLAGRRRGLGRPAGPLEALRLQQLVRRKMEFGVLVWGASGS